MPKLWRDGTADEVWKVIICASEVALAEETISRLTYILTDSGGNPDKGIEALRVMSGKEIIDGLLAYRESARQSVENGIKKAQT